MGGDIDLTGTPLEKWNEAEWLQFGVESQNWMLSQFMHGEQGALLCTAKIVETVPWIDAKYYAATQVMDEARHVEVFAKYLQDKLSGFYPINAHLKMLLDDIVNDSRWDMTYLGMQIMVEGLALAAFGFMHQLTTEPLLKQLLRYVMSDEARHVAFGVLSLKEYYAELTDAELKERQEFAFEAAVRMRDRFLQQEVWERMGVPVEGGRPARACRRRSGRCSSRCCSRRSSRTARSSACSTPTTAGCAASSPSSASSSSRTGPTPARSTRCSNSPRAKWLAELQHPVVLQAIGFDGDDTLWQCETAVPHHPGAGPRPPGRRRRAPTSSTAACSRSSGPTSSSTATAPRPTRSR